MAKVEIRNEKEEVVWQSPHVKTMMVEQVKNTVKVIDVDSLSVVGGYHLKPGERVVKIEDN